MVTERTREGMEKWPLERERRQCLGHPIRSYLIVWVTGEASVRQTMELWQEVKARLMVTQLSPEAAVRCVAKAF
jgi:hypothetical protein